MTKKLDECYEEFINEKKCYCEERTIEYYQDNLKEFIDYVAHRELDKQIYIDYVCHLRNKGIKNTSIRTYCRAVKVFSNWLCDNNYIDYDITYKVKLPRNDAEIVVPLSQEEVKQIDSVYDSDYSLDVRNRIIIHLMLDCGMRLSEVINLKCKDVDLINCIIYIKNSKCNKSRAVPVPEFLVNDIRKYLKFRINIIHEFLLFKSDNGPLTKDTVKCIFRNLKKNTGIKRLHPHLLRHTFATSYIMYNGNLEKLRILLGHSDYNVTKNYLHISAQMLLLHYDIYKLDKVYLEV